MHSTVSVSVAGSVCAPMRGYTGVACGAQNVTGTLGKSDHDGGGDQRQHHATTTQNHTGPGTDATPRGGPGRRRAASSNSFAFPPASSADRPFWTHPIPITGGQAPGTNGAWGRGTNGGRGRATGGRGSWRGGGRGTGRGAGRGVRNVTKLLDFDEMLHNGPSGQFRFELEHQGDEYNRTRRPPITQR